MDQLEFHFGSGSSSQLGLIEFLDSQAELSSSVRLEYPWLFGPDHGGTSLWVDVQGKIVSHVAYTVRTFRHPLFNFRVGLIGSVATDPEFRGRGLATSLMRQAMEDLKQRGCALAMLWSSDPAFYSSVGFLPAGRELELQFESPLSLGEEFLGVSEGFELREVADLRRLYCFHDVGLERTLEEFADLLKVPNLRCFVRREQGVPVAYALINKGSDFQDVIHEWAGTPEDILAILQFLKAGSYRERSLRLIAPAHRDLSLVESVATGAMESHMGLVKILDRTTLRSLFLSYVRDRGMKAEWTDVLRVDGEEIPTQTDADFMKAVFGNGSVLEGHWPRLPIFIWGLDSV